MAVGACNGSSTKSFAAQDLPIIRSDSPASRVGDQPQDGQGA
jgi:hypothetical protein